MVHNQNLTDNRTTHELYVDLLKTDWNIRETLRSTVGVTVSFRHHYTSDFPGMVTREVHAKDTDDAIRTFLNQLEDEKMGAQQSSTDGLSSESS